MTDNDIIKALECCGKEDYNLCSKCPLYIADHDNDFCQEDLHKASLALINRQKAEIEELKKGINIELDNFASEYDSKIKAEAVREFAERLKAQSILRSGCVPWFDIQETIDNLVKEMVGDAE